MEHLRNIIQDAKVLIDAEALAFKMGNYYFIGNTDTAINALLELSVTTDIFEVLPLEAFEEMKIPEDVIAKHKDVGNRNGFATYIANDIILVFRFYEQLMKRCSYQSVLSKDSDNSYGVYGFLKTTDGTQIEKFPMPILI